MSDVFQKIDPHPPLQPASVSSPAPKAGGTPKKIYRLKEDQAFTLSLELGRREKVLRHPSQDFLPLPPRTAPPPTCSPICLGGVVRIM